MLEVVNLFKIYETKGGAPVHALDGVSLSFPETGMVFLLGKSGSGKSTLLNLCGGLDSPTSGEIIIKGRSSASFSQSDFDSYRNTFVGFIFQEYNILNEFTVEENIALALELQGKSKNKEAINALLEQVDLAGLAKRKPNTLSGGQKQRIAIARALIKSPEIIMADEPSGALDSATGKQVFDTLKKLSQDKLVIVVSHDRDFAELYGDRIIELKDGKVISDVSKSQAEKTQVSENVTITGSTICIKNGESLTDNEFESIKDFLKRSPADVVISNGESDIKAFKETARITEEGDREVFVATDEGAIQKPTYTPEDSKFIRSKLPLKHAIKIGVSSLKTKPIRLIFTIFLCVVAFTLLGVFSTMTFYNRDATFTQSIRDAGLEHISAEGEYISKYKYFNNGMLEFESEQYGQAAITKAKLDELKSTLGDGVFGAVKLSYNYSGSCEGYSNNYYRSEITYFAPYNENMNLTFVHGRAPESDTELCVSSYIAETMQKLRMRDYKGVEFEFDSVDKLLNQKINVNERTLTIVGIFDSGAIPTEFDSLKEGNSNDWNLISSFDSELREKLHLVAICSPKVAFELGKELNKMSTESIYSYTNSALSIYRTKGNWSFDSGINSMYYSLSDKSSHDIYLFDSTKASLERDQVVLNFRTFVEFYITHSISPAVDKGRDLLNELETEKYRFREDLTATPPEGYDDIGAYISHWSNYVNPTTTEEQKAELLPYIPTETNHPTLLALYKEATDLYIRYYDAEKAVKDAENAYSEAYKYLSGYYYEVIKKPIDGTDDGSGKPEYTTEETTIYFSAEDKMAYAKKLYETYSDVALNVGFALCHNSEWFPLTASPATLTIVGVTDFDTRDDYSTRLYFSDEQVQELWEVQKGTTSNYNETETKFSYGDYEGLYSTVFIPIGSDTPEKLLEIYNKEGYDENDFRLYLTGDLVRSLDMINSFIDELSQIFLWIGIVMAVFAVLLFSNFITMSITNKKREIGILRAVGARGSDIFKIFFAESFVIALICTIISIGLSIGVCILLNTEMASSLGASIFNFGPLSFAVVIVLALLTALIATFLPVKNVASKKPVDSIRAV